jgi:hypothetical protein
VIRFNCVYCDNFIEAPETAIGRKGKCSKCNKILVVPFEDDLIATSTKRKKEPLFDESDYLISSTSTSYKIKEELVGEKPVYKHVNLPQDISTDFSFANTKTMAVWYKIIGWVYAVLSGLISLYVMAKGCEILEHNAELGAKVIGCGVVFAIQMAVCVITLFMSSELVAGFAVLVEDNRQQKQLLRHIANKE